MRRDPAHRASSARSPGIRRERVAISSADPLPRAVARSVREQNARSGGRGVSGFETRPAPTAEPGHTELRRLSERLRGRDHFEVLGIERAAGEDEVRVAYFDLAKTTHPDRFSGASEAVRRLAEEVFGKISQAYEVLGNRNRRNAYLKTERERERDEAAVEEAERAVRAEVEYQKGLARIKSKNYEDALSCFDRAVEFYPAEAEYLAWRGWALYLEAPNAAGRLGEARECLLQARKLAPDNEKVYLFLGRLFRAEGRSANAEKMFQRVIQLDPDCVDAIRELRLIDMRRQRSKSLVRRILRR
jgi:tetratricopeptide (TPR) repeat protein